VLNLSPFIWNPSAVALHNQLVYTRVIWPKGLSDWRRACLRMNANSAQ